MCTAVCDDELKPYLTFPTRIKSQIDFRSSDLLVSPRLNEDVEHFAFIIDCTPKIQAMPPGKLGVALGMVSDGSGGDVHASVSTPEIYANSMPSSPLTTRLV